jgi:hypothetical protein
VVNKKNNFHHPPKLKHLGRKIKGEQWRFPENDNDNSDDDPTFELGNKIETFNYDSR